MSGQAQRSNTLFFNKRKQTGFDWNFLDRIIREGFYVGGTDLRVYKYIGSYDSYQNLVNSSNPNQIFTATSEDSGGFRGIEKAFDQDQFSFYKSSNNPDSNENEYIEIDFGPGPFILINGVGIQEGELNSNPTAIKIMASQNGNSYEKIGEFYPSDDSTLQRFRISNTIPYRYYRIVPTEKTYGMGKWSVRKLELYSEAGESGCDIQDDLFLENRDRKYDATGCTLLCHYEIPEKPHDLSNIGFIIPADQIEITTLLSDTESILNRRIMIGDIITLPHIGDHSFDEGGLADSLDGRRYEVMDVSLAAAGYDPRWRDHLQRIVAAPLKARQETMDITSASACDPNNIDITNSASTLLDLNNILGIEAANAGEHGQDMSGIAHNASNLQLIGPRTLDSYPPNNEPYTEGLEFPGSPTKNDWFRHTGFDPVRLYQFNGFRWIRKEIDHRSRLDGRSTIRQGLKDHIDLPTSGSAIQQSLRDG